jgi:hypothetical protein
MHSVRVLEAAALEAEEAAVWYEMRRSGLGKEFRAAFKVALDRLREERVPGTPWPGVLSKRGVKRIGMKRFPFHVVFVATDMASVVLAVAHHRRRPGYWRGRLRHGLSSEDASGQVRPSGVRGS